MPNQMQIGLIEAETKISLLQFMNLDIFQAIFQNGEMVNFRTKDYRRSIEDLSLGFIESQTR